MRRGERGPRSELRAQEELRRHLSLRLLSTAAAAAATAIRGFERAVGLALFYVVSELVVHALASLHVVELTRVVQLRRREKSRQAAERKEEE